MSVLQQTRKVVQKITYYFAYAGMFALLPLMLLTSGDVIGRGVFNKPVPGTMELSSYILVIFILCGLAYTYQLKGHVRVTMLLDKLPSRLALGMETFTLLMSLFIVGIITVEGWSVAWDQNTVSDMLRVPQRPFRLLVSAAGLCFFLELVFELFDVLGRLFCAQDAA